MATTAREVLAQRAERDLARAKFDAQLGKVQADMEARGIAGRIADEVSDKASAAWNEAMELAGESKGVIAGTIGLLMLWFFRSPLVSALEDMLGGETQDEGYDYDEYE